jgi:hypothetical protein
METEFETNVICSLTDIRERLTRLEDLISESNKTMGKVETSSVPIKEELLDGSQQAGPQYLFIVITYSLFAAAG